MQFPLLTAFIVGLFTTLHCVGMCGGIMGALTYSLPRETRESPLRLTLHLIAYNLGRIGSYALAGALLGGAGASVLNLLGDTGHHALQTAAALLMTAIGLYVAGWFPKFAQLERIGVPLWRRLEPRGRALLPVRSPARAMVFGAVWGWLPCGMVYSMLLWSLATESPAQGMLAMAAFGAGTLPAVMGIGILSAWLGRVNRMPLVRQAAGLTLIVLSLGGLLLPDAIHGLTPSFSR